MKNAVERTAQAISVILQRTHAHTPSENSAQNCCMAACWFSGSFFQYREHSRANSILAAAVGWTTTSASSSSTPVTSSPAISSKPARTTQNEHHVDDTFQPGKREVSKVCVYAMVDALRHALFVLQPPKITHGLHPPPKNPQSAVPGRAFTGASNQNKSMTQPIHCVLLRNAGRRTKA